MFEGSPNIEGSPNNSSTLKRSWLAMWLALALLASACGSSTDSTDSVGAASGLDDSIEAGEAAADETSDEPIDATVDPVNTEPGETVATIAETIDDGGGPLDIDVDLLTAGTWTLRFGGGPDGDVSLVDGYPITITFDGDGSFGGSAACNGYGGTYDVDGPQIFFAEISWTEMACEPNVQASEGAFLSALMDSVDVNVFAEELALSGPSTELIFVPASLASLEPLWGRSFTLEALLVDGAPAAPIGTDDGEDVILAIHPDDSFSATTGCRGLEGMLVVSGSEVFVPEARADGDCPAALADQDSHIVSVLGDKFTFEYDGGQLLVSSGNQGLQYRDNTGDAVVDAPDEVPGDAVVESE